MELRKSGKIEAEENTHKPKKNLPFSKQKLILLQKSNLTEVFPCFLLSCKANARVKPAKTGHGPHSF
jgi:hypothetical protein